MTVFSLFRLPNALKATVSTYTSLHQKPPNSADYPPQHPILWKKTLLFPPQNIAFLHQKVGM